ncbi:helix-turn-helix domain-containing protein [Streptomyces sp. R1]|uniref:XRE family transcriptional regulator n=1 Tax=Streptomyces sp. R1 TaxID=1509279 RepID=UPI001E4F5D77|nr:XRE family transcriptional regulator [Streptomyces sp. R1]MCC8339026.1 helix-turn-helix domain-containing protein [Streptomyces sp. R1]
MESGSGTRFGRLLRELRQGHGLTLEELAEVSGVSGRAIGDMERGRSLRPRRGTITALSQGLGLDEPTHATLLSAARASTVPKRSAHSPSTPCSVPRSVPDFVGRRTELDALRDLVRRNFTPSAPPDHEGTGSAPPVAVVFGPPGCGKSTLATRLVQEYRDTLADRAFQLDMRGLDAQPLTADEASARLLSAWGVDDSEVAGLTGEDRIARYHALAARLPAVVILDNAASEAQVRPLLPHSGSQLTIVTSRHTLAGLEGVHRMELGALTPQESVSLLRAVVGGDRVDAEPEAARAVAELCGHLPLALRLAANWAATRTRWNLEKLAARLADEDRRLDLLGAGDIRVSSAFSLSYSRLDPGTARMFRLLSLVPGGDFSAPMAAVLAGLSPVAAEDLLEVLLDVGLLGTHQADRYRVHDLLHLYARSRHRADDDPQESVARSARLRAWLLDTAALAGRCHEPGHVSAAPDRDRLVALDSPEQALQWIKAESDNWAAAFRHASDNGDHTTVIDVAEAMRWAAKSWVSSGLWVDMYTRSTAAAEALGDSLLEATHRNYLAWALTSEHRIDDVAACAQRALTAARAAGSVAQEAWAHSFSCVHKIDVGDHEGAADSASRALDLFRQDGDPNGYLQGCNVAIVGMAAAGRWEEAIEIYQQAMAVLDDPDNVGRIPPAIRAISVTVCAYEVSSAYIGSERWRDVVDVLGPVRGGLAAIGRYRQEAEVRLHLAHAFAHLGERTAAADEYRGVRAMEGTVPAELLEAARVRLDALAEGRTDPPTTPF